MIRFDTKKDMENVETFTHWVDPTIEEKDKEIHRLNNIIDELEKELEFEINDYNGNIDLETRNIDSEFLRGNAWEADYLLNKLKKLKEGK